jgi:hypothetical protein
MSDTWSIEALIARFELHPEFKEVYVEGDSDIGLYQLFLEEGERDDVVVYPISAVTISQEIRDNFAFPNMNDRSRRTDVILLALLLEQRIPSAANHISCIADADSQLPSTSGQPGSALAFCFSPTTQASSYTHTALIFLPN